MTSVFISYRRVDVDFADRLREELLALGHQVWMDIYDIPQGAYWRTEIDNGLVKSQVVIGVMSPEALGSRNVMNEWYWALDNNRRFLPLKLRECKTVPHSIAAFNHIDFSDKQEAAFTQLAEFLSNPEKTMYRDMLSSGATATGIYHMAEMVARRRTQETLLDPQDTRAPSLSEPTTTSRDRLLDKVREYWIEGVLEQSLMGGHAIELSLAGQSDAIIKHREYGDYAMPAHQPIINVFEDMGRELLILGAPGAGKTFTMLQLARELITRAREDETQPVPLVLNLSSWADKRNNLEDWLVEEMNGHYHVPKKVARRSIENGQDLFLLDGLDEVKETQRDACVAAINQFRGEYPYVDMVVCSRLQDYELLTEHLNLEGAIALQPLNEAQINRYIAGQDYAGVQAVLKSDDTLKAMTTSPFLLNVIAFTYRDMTANALTLPPGENTETERRHHLFDRYLSRRFKEGAEGVYTLKEMRHYLAALAQKMNRRANTVFLIERIQPDWLPESGVRRFFNIITYTLVALISGVLPLFLVAGIATTSQPDMNFFSVLPNYKLWIFLAAYLFGFVIAQPFGVTFRGKLRLAGAIIFPFLLLAYYASKTPIDQAVPFVAVVLVGAELGLIHALVFAIGRDMVYGTEDDHDRVRLVEQLGWSWRKSAPGMLAGLGMGYAILLLFLGMTVFAQETSGVEMSINPFTHFIVPGTFAGLLFAPVLGLLRGISSDEVQVRVRPNQGIWGSARNAAWISIITIAFLTIGFRPAIGVGNAMNELATQDDIGIGTAVLHGVREMGNFSIRGMYLPLVLFPNFALLFGGLTVIQHVILRWMLVRRRLIPQNYAQFLDEAAGYMLMRKVGGGYIFVHKYLLEYFAELEGE